MAVVGLRCALCALLCVTALLTAEAVFIDRKVDRLPEPEDFTETLEPHPHWFRECYYRLESSLQVAFRLCNSQIRERMVEVLKGMPGMHRHEELVRALTDISDRWKDEDGFDLTKEAAELASRNAALRGRSGGGSDDMTDMTDMTDDMTDPGEADAPGDDAGQSPSRRPLVVGPLRPFALPSLWELLAAARRAGNDTGLWRLSLSGGDQLVVAAVRQLDPADTVSLLPVYGRKTDARPELVQLTFRPSEASLRQLMRLPDELLRTMAAREAARLPARTATAVSVEHAGDVTVTGALTAAGAGNMTDTQLETLVHSLLQRRLMVAELASLAALVGRHWPDERTAWSPTHVSVLAAHRCDLVPHVPLPALLPLDADSAASVVRSCQSVWRQAPAGGSALGLFVRSWLGKELDRRGPLAGWSPAKLSEMAPLLVGALPEELAEIAEDRQVAAGASLAFASLDRVQAQPVIAGQLAANNLTSAGRLYELLRHLQPQHVRRLGRLRHQLLALSPWLLDARRENGQFATHLQFRLMLDQQLQRGNLTAEDFAALGPFFYTLPLADVFNLLVDQQVQLTPALLASISSPRLEPMTRRLLMSTFMRTSDRLCPGCLRGVPAELLGSMTDSSLTQLRLRGLLDQDAVAQLMPASDFMLPGKRGELLEAARRLLRRADAHGPVVAGSRQLWALAGPADMPLLVPAVIRRMEELALHVDAAALLEAAAQYPRPLLAQLLAHYRGQQPDGLWTTESLLGRRPGRRRAAHGPWVYLAGLSCADVAAVTPLDLPPIAEAYERRLQAVGEPMPLSVCVCLQQRLVLYLQVRHAVHRQLNAVDGRELALTALQDSPLHRLPVAEVRALPACVLLLLPRHYLLSLSPEARLAAWLKIGRLTWPDIATHLSVQRNQGQFRWVARQLLHDLNVTNSSRLTFEHVAQLNQLLHFVDADVIARIEPDAFREWIYTLRSGAERLVCRPHRAWAELITRAFGPAAAWNMSTPYYLGGWIFALNATERANISRQHLRLAVDNHNAALFQELPDVIGRRSGRAVTFLEACRELNDTSHDLRLLFDASRLAGVVGYPKPRARRSASPALISSGELSQLSQDLMSALKRSKVSEQVRGQAEVLVEELVASMGDGADREEPATPFEFVPAAGGRLRCEDLRAAGPAAVAVRPPELQQMAGADLHGLWSCLNTLGRLRWPLSGHSVAEVWQAVREANGDRLQPDNMVHLGGLVAALTPDELRQVRIAAPGQALSTDALSVLGSVAWRADQLAALVNTTLGVTDDPRTSRVRLYAEPQTVTALGSLLCGFSPSQLHQLFNGSRPHLYRDTAAAVGRVVGCPHDSVLETLAELAVETFGPTSGWSELTVATVGAAVAGLRRWQFDALPPEALRGLTSVAARRAAASVLATELSAAQLRHLPPQSARELLSQPGLDTRQLDALEDAVHGRRSARAAADPPPPPPPPGEPVTDTDGAAQTADKPHPEPGLEPEPEPESEPELESRPYTEPQPQQEPSVEPRSDSEEEQERPDSQGVTQERVPNSTAPLLAGQPALWLTLLLLAAPAA